MSKPNVHLHVDHDLYYVQHPANKPGLLSRKVARPVLQRRGQDGITTYTIKSRVGKGVTDLEHDTAWYLLCEVAALSTVVWDVDRITIVGTVTDLRAHEDPDHVIELTECSVCDGSQEHLMAEYLPPQSDWSRAMIGKFASIEIG